MSITEGDLKTLAESQLATNLFGTAESFLQLYRSQTNCLQFGSLPIPQRHCLHTYELMLGFISDSRKWHSSVFEIATDSRDNTRLVSMDLDATPFLGSVHHFLQSNKLDTVPISLVANRESASRFWHILEAHNKLDRQIISRYATRDEDEHKKRNRRINELTNQDKTDIRSIKRFIEEEFAQFPNYLAEFYLLLFFDIHSAFLFFDKGGGISDESGETDEVMKRMSHFVLRILPQVIGTYRFGELNSQLKDLAFHNADKENYLETEAVIRKRLPDRAWQGRVCSELKDIGDKLPVRVSVLQRQKSTYSAFLKSLNYATPVESLWDLFGFRVVIDSDDTKYCYEFLSKVQEKFKQWPGPKGYTDYIANRKKNGYQSLHVILEDMTGAMVEVQIRTSRMNVIAEFGTASHQIYSGEGTYGEEVTPSARKGREIVERRLRKHGLSINDFIEHLGVSLEHVPIEHYYEGIASGEYNVMAMIERILQDRRSL